MSDPTFAMGKYYYMGLREEYGDESPEKLITIDDPNEPEDVQLTKCLKKLFAQNREFEPLSEFSHTCQAINQKNTAALCRAILRVSPLASIDNAILILDVLRMITRLSLYTKCLVIFLVVRCHFDRACVKSYLHFRANGQTCNTWWDAHHSIAELIVPKPQVEAAFACTTDFSDIKDIVATVGLLGAR